MLKSGQQAFYLFAGTLITLLLQMTAGSIGPVGIFFNLLTPLPAAFLHMRKGMLAGGGIVLLTTVILFAVVDAGGATAYLLQFGLGSIVLPFLLRRGWPWDKAIAGALVVVLGAVAFTLVGYAAYRGFHVTDLVHQYMQGEIDKALAIYQEANLSEEQFEELRTVARRVADFLASAYPGLAVILTGVLLSLVVLVLSAFSSDKYVLAGVPFHLWKAPEPMIWLLIVAGFGMVFLTGSLHLVALNLLTVLLPVYFLQGLAIVNHFFRKKGVSPLLQTLGYLLIAVLNPFPLIVTGVGIFDLWADFRKPRKKRT
jgi:uncharacterized protein YybS (DUF2232 family)